MIQRFSKDPKSREISLSEFLDYCNYLPQENKDFFKSKPEPDTYTYKITGTLFIRVSYSEKYTNYGTCISEKLEEILVAYRDGVTEYRLYNEKIEELKRDLENHKRSKIRKRHLAAVEDIVKNMPAYGLNDRHWIKKEFQDYLYNVGYVTKYKSLKNTAVVFDVETNGLRKVNDDLLSLSIYDPSSGICYNRFFPLDLQPVVLTTYIHGITDEDLLNVSHWSQKEIDKIIDFFHLKERKLLSYSGGTGTFDKSFVINYCKRHKLHGFEDLTYQNIKSFLPPAPYGYGGQLSKDNLCRKLGIDGVKDIHSSMNDCLLEWKLYEHLMIDRPFLIGGTFYKYSDDYIIPVSYLNSQQACLERYANIKVPFIKAVPTLIYQFQLPNNVLKKVKKFETNISGITLEEGIRYELNAIEQDNLEFLVRNKSHLKAIFTLKSPFDEIPIIKGGDGTVRTLDPKREESIKQVNAVTKIMMESIAPVIKFIQEKIFHNKEIMSQELVISKDRKILALCDFSNEKSVLEMKTYSVINADGSVNSALARQLYYQSNGRKCYVLSIIFKNDEQYSLENVALYIYEVNFEESNPQNSM